MSLCGKRNGLKSQPHQASRFARNPPKNLGPGEPTRSVPYLDSVGVPPFGVERPSGQRGGAARGVEQTTDVVVGPRQSRRAL